jgi:hypothetical protein
MRIERPSNPASEVVRLVLGGFDEAARLRTAYSELRGAGLPDDQLCIIRMSNAGARVDGEPLMRYERHIDGIRLVLSSEALFDGVRLAETEPFGTGAPWMPARQAAALWRHIREGWPALLAGARSSEEQVACCHMQLRHRPRFLHTFNFSLA